MIIYKFILWPTRNNHSCMETNAVSLPKFIGCRENILVCYRKILTYSSLNLEEILIFHCFTENFYNYKIVIHGKRKYNLKLITYSIMNWKRQTFILGSTGFEFNNNMRKKHNYQSGLTKISTKFGERLQLVENLHHTKFI